MDDFDGEIVGVPISALDALSQNDLKALLKRIFSRILRQPCVADEDDFFDLGGDSILAIALFNEIEKVTGRLLPLTALYEAPSVSALARLLSENKRPEFSCLTLLKSGKLDTPLFLVPGIAGAVMELRELARRTDINQAIYGLETGGIDGAKEPCDNVEELARFHVNNITSIQPEGPYYLVGYSFGGLVALEMALMLLKAGKTVALLAMIDTFPHLNYWPLWCRLSGIIKIIRSYFFEIPWLKVLSNYTSIARSMPFYLAIWFLLVRVWWFIKSPFNPVQMSFWINRYQSTGTSRSFNINKDLRLPVNLQNVRSANSQAFKYYKPNYYPSELTFIKADDTIFFDAQKFWEKLCVKLAIRVVEGDHHSMVKVNSGPLALVLTSCVQKASRTNAI